MSKNAPIRFALFLLLATAIMPLNKLHAQSSCVPPQDPAVGTDSTLPDVDADDDVVGSDPQPVGEPAGALTLQVVAFGTLLGVRLS